MNMATRPDQMPHAPVFQPGRVLRVHGMRRSGNHAILDAFLRNAPNGNAVFFNNCKAPQDPCHSYRGLDVRRNGHKVDRNGTLDDTLAQAGARPLTIVSVEDSMPRAHAAPIWGTEEQVVLIYRSFLNWAASLLKKIKGNASYGPVERMRIMTNACRTYGQALNMLDGPVVPVLYDKWIRSRGYRAETLAALGLETSDLSLGQVQRYGGGSSFQPEAQDAADLTVDQRADQMANDPEFGMLVWLVAHDIDLSQAIARHFPSDAERILGLAETAGLTFHLPEGAGS